MLAAHQTEVSVGKGVSVWPTGGTCNSQQFQCADGSRCIPIHMKCNGDRNCADGSDEADCGKRLQLLHLHLLTVDYQLCLSLFLILFESCGCAFMNVPLPCPIIMHRKRPNNTDVRIVDVYFTL